MNDPSSIAAACERPTAAHARLVGSSASAWVLLALAAGCAAPPSASPPPNVVLFVADDLGVQDVAASLQWPGAFHSRFRTPNLERLAARSTRFTEAYAAAPVCTPSRVALLAGRSPAETHVTYWVLQAERDTSAPFPGLAPPPWNLRGLQPGDVTLATLARQAGVRTIQVGKWHLGAVGTPGADPRNLGFDVSIGGHGAGAPGSHLGRDSFRGSDPTWHVPGLERWHGEDVFLDEALAEEAVAAVRASAAEGRSFFLYFAPYGVHAPIQANERYLASYADLEPREAAYATMVETVDAALGRVLDTLDELGLADETWIVFTSDNGGLSAHGRGGVAHGHNAPFRSGKGSAYDGGTRVPLLVHRPGEAGTRVSTRPVTGGDVFATLASALGMAGRAPQTREVWRVLEPGEEDVERALVWHQPHFWGVEGPGIWPYSALRAGNWKLIFRHADRGFELYDLARDPGETRDLAQSEPGRVQALARELGSRLRAAGAQMSIETSTGRPVAWPDEVAARR